MNTMKAVRKAFFSHFRSNRLLPVRRLTTNLAPSLEAKEDGTRNYPPKSISVAGDKKSLTVHWLHRPPTSYHAVWLRYQCWCPDCRTIADEATFYNPCQLLPKYTIDEALEKDGYLHLKWKEKEQGRSHSTKIPLWFLEKHAYWGEGRTVTPKEYKWEALKHPVPVEYKDFISSDEVVFEFMKTAASGQLALLKNVPPVPGKSVEIGLKMSEHIFQYHYGPVEEVKSDPPEIAHNVGNLTMELPFHMDHQWRESPPGYLSFHCLTFDKQVQGGESVFLNAFYEAELFRKEHPAEFDVLSKVPAAFHLNVADANLPGPVPYSYSRPHITLNSLGHITGVSWAPDLHGPMAVSPELVQPYYEAYNKFAKFVESSPRALEVASEPGDFVLLSNRAVFHARNAFELNGGMRHLQSMFLGVLEFRRQLAKLAVKLGRSLPPITFGDQDEQNTQFC